MDASRRRRVSSGAYSVQAAALRFRARCRARRPAAPRHIFSAPGHCFRTPPRGALKVSSAGDSTASPPRSLTTATIRRQHWKSSSTSAKVFSKHEGSWINGNPVERAERPTQYSKRRAAGAYVGTGTELAYWERAVGFGQSVSSRCQIISQCPCPTSVLKYRICAVLHVTLTVSPSSHAQSMSSCQMHSHVGSAEKCRMSGLRSVLSDMHLS